MGAAAPILATTGAEGERLRSFVTVAALTVPYNRSGKAVLHFTARSTRRGPGACRYCGNWRG